MINYVEMKIDGAYLYPQNKRVSYAAITYIKRVCIEHLFTYEGYIKAVKKKLLLTSKIPVVVSGKIIFFQTKSTRVFDNIWINYNSILNVEKCLNNINIKFIDGTSKMIEISYNSYKRIVMTIFKILKYKESLV